MNFSLGDEMVLSKDIIMKAIKKFNETFAPETTAEFVGISKDENKFAVKFSRACMSCGMYDYFLDFIEILEDLTKKKFHIEDEIVVVDPLVWILIISVGEGKHKHKVRGNIIEYDKKWNIMRIKSFSFNEK